MEALINLLTYKRITSIHGILRLLIADASASGIINRPWSLADHTSNIHLSIFFVFRLREEFIWDAMEMCLN